MNIVMGVPIKVSIAMSNFMTTFTAFASIIVYFMKGALRFSKCPPIVAGTILGTLMGTSYKRVTIHN
ncbi:MAG: sulfite exporter TauE/SafE family protein [Candidatus Methanomethyliaceae archaeon]|nr:sulfite exporter TauE/SafE family protein [Candidatus Methanomethyliaceae archaeon]